MRREEEIKKILAEDFKVTTPAIIFMLRNGLISITVKKIPHKCGHTTNLVAVVPCQDSLRAFHKQATKHTTLPCRKCMAVMAREAADNNPFLVITALDAPIGRRLLSEDRHLAKLLTEHFTSDRLLSLLERSLYLHPEEAVKYITYKSGEHHNGYQGMIRKVAAKTLKNPKQVHALKVPEKALYCTRCLNLHTLMNPLHGLSLRPPLGTLQHLLSFSTW